MTTTLAPPAPAQVSAPRMAGAVLGAVSFCHLLNDLMQSAIPAIYPLLKDSYHLSFHQVGLITLSNQVTASLLQPVVGTYTDRRPQAYSLSVGMAFSLVGLVLLAVATSLPLLMGAAALVGIGSSVFHPEASRIARLASGGRHGLAQSVFQVGGNLGSALGPLMVVAIVAPRGQGAIGWFSLAALLAMLVLLRVGAWYGAVQRRPATAAAAPRDPGLSRQRIAWSLAILGILVFSKYVYLASLTNFYTFYLRDHFHLGTDAAQMHLFYFLAAVAAGTVLGGPIGDRIGRKRVIWASILGVAPFTLALPHAGLLGTEILVLVIGFVLASAFSAILVFAQELVPGRVGMISGLFFGFAFGVAGIGAAALGSLADRSGLDVVYRVCAFLPLIGIVTVFLPRMERPRPA